MPRTRAARHALDLDAARILAANVDPVMATIAASLAEVEPGQTALAPCVRDARLVLDIASRLDEAIPLPEPVESFDRLAWVLVAAIGLAIYRRSQRAPSPRARAAELAAVAVKQAGKRLAV